MSIEMNAGKNKVELIQVRCGSDEVLSHVRDAESDGSEVICVTYYQDYTWFIWKRQFEDSSDKESEL